MTSERTIPLQITSECDTIMVRAFKVSWPDLDFKAHDLCEIETLHYSTYFFDEELANRTAKGEFQHLVDMYVVGAVGIVEDILIY